MWSVVKNDVTINLPVGSSTAGSKDLLTAGWPGRRYADAPGCTHAPGRRRTSAPATLRSKNKRSLDPAVRRGQVTLGRGEGKGGCRQKRCAGKAADGDSGTSRT